MLQGVEGVLIAGNDGQIHKTTLSEQMTQEYASQIPSLAALARNVVRDLDAQVSNVVLSCASSNTWVSSSMLDWQEQ
jgi:predicted regulator of Ras-like GTPase activity (Roadblock/LC7/MglB family)